MSEIVTGKQLGLTAVRGQMLLPSEIALILRVSERWVQDRMHNGTFPVRWYYINEKARAVDSEDLNDWLRKIRVEAGTALLPTKALKEIQGKEASA
jgi:hypothetical protein